MAHVNGKGHPPEDFGYMEHVPLTKLYRYSAQKKNFPDDTKKRNGFPLILKIRHYFGVTSEDEIPIEKELKQMHPTTSKLVPKLRQLPLGELSSLSWVASETVDVARISCLLEKEKLGQAKSQVEPRLSLSAEPEEFHNITNVTFKCQSSIKTTDCSADFLYNNISIDSLKAVNEFSHLNTTFDIVTKPDGDSSSITDTDNGNCSPRHKQPKDSTAKDYGSEKGEIQITDIQCCTRHLQEQIIRDLAKLELALKETREEMGEEIKHLNESVSELQRGHKYQWLEVKKLLTDIKDKMNMPNCEELNKTKRTEELRNP
ncbi:unnamed protein product [Mytilus edulis]|uniref:Uncharacterized protein n=1 Tax=Mytilus edulis TaxID=6550 RepID=A0A8S3SA39_MYTED|nr:unnamed protein product [Mytilus edulis]